LTRGYRAIRMHIALLLLRQTDARCCHILTNFDSLTVWQEMPQA